MVDVKVLNTQPSVIHINLRKIVKVGTKDSAEIAEIITVSVPPAKEEIVTDGGVTKKKKIAGVAYAAADLLATTREKSSVVAHYFNEGWLRIDKQAVK